MEDALLVTGGAGYIGSHTVRRLLEDNRRVVILDDLSTGHQEVATFFERVYGPSLFCFEKVDLLNREALDAVFARHAISGIIDFAARSLVGESQTNPRLYFDQNVLAFRNLMDASRGIPIVKSSTSATYGEPAGEDLPLQESYQNTCVNSGRYQQTQLMPAKISFEGFLAWYQKEVADLDPTLSLTDNDRAHLLIPTNIYGISKVMDERILAHCKSREGRSSVVLRYFNAAGADRSRLIGEDHDPESHLIPLILQVALGQREAITVYGNDYDTPDGTAIRDYVSVEDLADGHVRSLDHLLEGGESRTYNLGTSEGYSVREIIEAARSATGLKIPERNGERRSGDPARLIADSRKIREELGWKAASSLEDTVESAWNWHRLNPYGYRVVQEERYNPFWGRWINIAAHRGNRPWSGETQDLSSGETPAYDPDCYLCPGNERASGERNPDYEGVWSFTNDFSSLTLDAYEADGDAGPYRTRTSRGLCEVVNYNPNHTKRLATMSVEEISAVVDGWVHIYNRLGGQDEITYPLIFENYGTIMGNSQPHPHGQVYAYGEIPGLMVEPQLREFAEYRAKHDACFVCEANRMECEDGRRILTSNNSFLSYVPFAAQYPYDITIVPRAHVASLNDLDEDARANFARLLQNLLTGLDRLFGTPYHYTLALIQTPTDGIDYGFHMQAHITSLLRGPGLRKHVVGADIFGNLINPSDPNISAEEIRRAIVTARKH
jgi:UDP-glucose 4-epimerase